MMQGVFLGQTARRGNEIADELECRGFGDRVEVLTGLLSIVHLQIIILPGASMRLKDFQNLASTQETEIQMVVLFLQA